MPDKVPKNIFPNSTTEHTKPQLPSINSVMYKIKSTITKKNIDAKKAIK